MSANVANSPDGSFDTPLTEFRIAVFSVPEQPEVLEQALMKLPEMDRATARLLTHLLPGLLPQSYSQEAATKAAEEMQRRGMNAISVPVTVIPDLRHVHQTHHVRLTDQALEALDTSGQLQLCPWSGVSVISVGVLPSSAPPHFRSTSMFSSGSSHRSWNEGVRISGKLRPEAFLVLSDGLTALHFASDEMNYECLGDRKETASLTNFQLLIRDLVSHATGAWLTPSTLAFLEHSAVPRSDFRSPDEFRRYTEFQSLLSRRQTNQPAPQFSDPDDRQCP